MKKIIILAMALSLALVGMVQADVLLVGGNLTVGVGNDGGLVSLPVSLNPLGLNQGVTYTGPGNTLPNDYTLPGTPWEFYSIGVAGSWTAYGVPGFSSPTSAGQTTLNTSGGTTLQAETVGPAFTVGAAGLIYKQTVVFDTTSNAIKISADIYNNTASTITGVVYARGMDPDQDVNSGGGFATFNSFLGVDKVMAVGPSTGMFVIMSDLSGSGVASISGSSPSVPWETNPYVLAGGGLLNGAIVGNPFDYSINMAWEIGDIPAFTSVEIDMKYQFAAPIPGSLLLLGSGILGLVGIGVRRKSA
jgi:hypothetical protein